MSESQNIISKHQESVSTHQKEILLSQKGLVIWFTGLSGSGKSTLAFELEKKLYDANYLTKVLDGDLLRNSINKGLGFSNEDRFENIRRTAEIAKLLTSCGVISICSLITPTNELRALAKNIVNDHKFVLVYLSTTLDVCEKRDVKGHYEKARAGGIKQFTGVSNPFETPNSADITLDTSKLSIDNCVSSLLDYILPFIKL